MLSDRTFTHTLAFFHIVIFALLEILDPICMPKKQPDV